MGVQGAEMEESLKTTQIHNTANDARHAFLCRLLSSSARFQKGLIISKVEAESWGITLRGF